uniref:glucan 1,4-alpha-glucosidase n=1 Tax=Chromera velia CCMP2878 TaxID=1169474 RepID=A0A0G4G7C0_9ALVE|mmetsp:Transcript_15057/g.30501  ORF Transcript_15057/g.30501 Transcript_15057/m.30501 type:complete len:517 (-) Transcript_15057:1217-2767(-)|eukprot:Cvel_20567.t1-p1 / transcript=Cvel_20567.t1 / gene=Cvel_20567 / organism=Chromera_velia_CCMP2878 / gene_product=Glucoamylase, putative / transcript_product=Glucoamylase, putative / location=Cvel_scaffold1857:24103-26691(+) / protein_length=516 / sequence_SO=supercontig / SO=protein_coding / is_pseudo=false
MAKLFVLSLLGLHVTLVASHTCTVPEAKRTDCGYVGINEDECVKKNCCWEAAQSSDTPWCFFSAEETPACPLAFKSKGSPFDKGEMETFRSLFLTNIDVNKSGAVVASPDPDTPGGSYYFDWSRDEALTMMTLFKTSEFTPDIDQTFRRYSLWVAKVLKDSESPTGVNMRIEVKFNVPEGTAFTGPWCRPQTDAPPLRAQALMLYAEKLISLGRESEVSDLGLWDDSAPHGGLIKYNLEWIMESWKSEGCDLWEEVRNKAFFWNSMHFRAALIRGAAFARSRGDEGSAERYEKEALQVQAAIEADHFREEADGTLWVAEADNRDKDAAVPLAFATADLEDGFLSASSPRVLGSLAVLSELFCSTFRINQEDTKNGVPGVMLGRYRGDVYAGGNPWIIGTAAMAQVMYRAAKELRASAKKVDPAVVSALTRLLSVEARAVSDNRAAATALEGAADGILLRVRYHAEGLQWHLPEQFDRESGMGKSAKDLTWSFATVLDAMAERGEGEEKTQYFLRFA